MSKNAAAREVRRQVRNHFAKNPLQKVVPSKKGLATVYLFTALLGYLTGLLAQFVRSH